MRDQTLGRHEVYRATLDASGRIVVPAELRSVLGVSPGDALLIYRDQAGVHVETPDQAIADMQRFFGELASPDVNLVDELLAERRADAERE
jgi:AbrB family looped-hinge helix DNA binding protein